MTSIIDHKTQPFYELVLMNKAINKLNHLTQF